MSSSAALDQLDTLDDRLDALLPFLTPLLARNIADTATSLPVADKARLYVLVTYVLESLLFCSFRPLLSFLHFHSPPCLCSLSAAPSLYQQRNES